MQVFHVFSLKQATINLRSSLLNNRAEFGTNIYEVKSQKEDTERPLICQLFLQHAIMAKPW